MQFENFELVLGNEFSILLCVILVIWIPLYTWYQLRKWEKLISPRLKQILVVLRIVLAAVLFLILLNIKFVFKEPDGSAFSFALLLDNSGSMNVKDINGGTRLNYINQKVLSEKKLLSDLQKKYHTIPFVFEEKVVAEPDIKQLIPTSKQTDIDKSLFYILERMPVQTLGGVLLITDGNDNIDENLIKAGMHYQDIGIPVSVIGVGSKDKKGDLSLTIKSSPKKLERGEEGDIIIKLARNRMSFKESLVKLQQSDELIKDQKVVWNDDELEKEIVIKVSSYRGGNLNLHASVQVFPDEMDLTNNEQFVTVEITEPRLWKILYLGAALNWEYTFLNRQYQVSDQFLLHSVVKKDEKAFHITGLEEEVKVFPEFPILKNYQALIIDINAVPLMSSTQINDIKEYLNRVGGGVLFMGPYVNSKPLDPTILDLLPVKPGAVTSFRGKREVEFKSKLLFSDHFDEKEEPWLKALYLPEQQFIQKIESYKLGTQKIMEAVADDTGILTIHHFGSGKVAFLGMDCTWKWNMENDIGYKNYRKFWDHLLQWLTATAKEPLTVTPNMEKLEMNQMITINASLLDEKYTATDDASVTINVYEPGETVPKSYKMSNDSIEKGRYQKEIFLSKEGEYRYEVTAVLANLAEGKPIVRTAKSKFRAIETGTEAGDSSLKEELLEDLARLSGGKYWHCSDEIDLNKLPLSKNVKMKTKEYHLNDGFFLLILSMALLLTDVFLRRKNGLK